MKREYVDQAIRDVIEHFGPSAAVRLELGIVEALSLIGALQLALRHTRLPADAALVARVMIDALSGQVGCTEAICKMIELGFDPNADVPTSGGDERRCRYCGCTDFDACADDGSGHPCHWVAVDVCSNPRCVTQWAEDGAGEEIYAAPDPGNVAPEQGDQS